jgi:phospholipid/cholesterol/gamma-HCH transport system permease protein
MSEAAADRAMRFEVPSEDTLTVFMSGRWTSVHELALPAEVLGNVTERTRRIECDGTGISAWDSTFLTFLRTLTARCAERDVTVAIDGLPGGVQRLLALASAVPEHVDAGRHGVHEGWLAFVGRRVISFVRSTGEMLAFLGECLLSLGRLLRGKAVFRRVDLWLLMQETGAHALPIVSLISALVGLILAFVGAYQLRMFGAEVYIAAGVGLGMVREMAPIMTGILLAGRTGAAFAAQIGTMQLNEEVDALETMGISAFDFLILPRVIAMGLMAPMLCLYSGLMGIVGGAIVGSSMFGIPLAQYFEQTWATVGLADFAIGIFKSAIFGVVVAVSGCMRGMQCGRSASAVGEAATSAVVTGIVTVIVVDSLAAVISTVFGF